MKCITQCVVHLPKQSDKDDDLSPVRVLGKRRDARAKEPPSSEVRSGLPRISQFHLELTSRCF